MIEDGEFETTSDSEVEGFLIRISVNAFELVNEDKDFVRIGLVTLERTAVAVRPLNQETYIHSCRLTATVRNVSESPAFRHDPRQVVDATINIE